MQLIQDDPALHEALRHSDVVVAGAGFAGAVLAERCAAALGKRVLVLDKRAHIAGNCFDSIDDYGILVHRYGPHIFHTSRPSVVDYLSRFTQWLPYEHRVLARVGDLHVPVPFNYTAIDLCFPAAQAQSLKHKLEKAYAPGQPLSILELRKASDAELRELAEFVYARLFIHYTAKQWGVSPAQVSPAVLGRVPVVLSHDDRYFRDSFQHMPTLGYTHIIERMLTHPRIAVALQRDLLGYLQIDAAEGSLHLAGKGFSGKLVYTGPLDELFQFCHGELSYRSLQFSFEHYPQERFQPAATVNYPGAEAFTRITEFRQINDSFGARGTTIVREFPQDYCRQDPQRNVPYYPVANPETEARYRRYAEMAALFPQLLVCGRLGDFRYYNMDDTVQRSLDRFEELRKASKVDADDP